MSVIVTAEINTAEFRRAIAQEEERVRLANIRTSEVLGKRGVQLFQGVTSNWANKPRFEMETGGTANSIEVIVGTDDKIFGYLDRGTAVRYAVMSRDFRAKTSPGSLQSGPGSGRVVFISRKHPRPGIQARHFSVKVAETLNREAEQTFNREIKRVR